MRKLLLFITTLLLISLLIAGCSPNAETTAADETKPEVTTLKVGATPVPHAELLALIGDDLAAQNIELEVIEFTDYVKPNLALNDKEIDANFFQHIPYLESFAADHNLSLVSVGPSMWNHLVFIQIA